MREKKEINVQIGEQIKLAREDAHLTQEVLSERIGVSPQYISDLERGVVGVSVATLKKICECLAVSSDQILFGKQTADPFFSILSKSRTLNSAQRLLLTEIADRYIAAIESERRN